MPTGTGIPRWAIPDDIHKQLVECGSLQYTQMQIADHFGIGITTWKRYRNDHPEWQETLNKARMQVNGAVIKTAIKMALSGNHPAMTIFWLKVQCRWSETNKDIEEAEEIMPSTTPDAARMLLEERLKETR